MFKIYPLEKFSLSPINEYFCIPVSYETSSTALLQGK